MDLSYLIFVYYLLAAGSTNDGEVEDIAGKIGLVKESQNFPYNMKVSKTINILKNYSKFCKTIEMKNGSFRAKTNRFCQ